MKDLSLHILDIAQNSIRAGATVVSITVAEDLINDRLTITIEDNGSGMSAEILAKVTDPFYTSRTTRKVGLGLPLFKQNAEMTGGTFSITSEPGKGTLVTAIFGHSHLDRPPLGDMAGVIIIIVGSEPDKEFVYRHTVNEKEYVFDTREVKEVLDDMSIGDLSVRKYLKEMISENLKELME